MSNKQNDIFNERAWELLDEVIEKKKLNREVMQVEFLRAVDGLLEDGMEPHDLVDMIVETVARNRGIVA